MSDAEPKATSATPPPDAETEKQRKRTKRPKGRPLALETELEDLLTQIGAGVMMINQFDGLVLVNQASENANALAKIANKNARVKKALERLTDVSAMAGVASVIGGTAVPILMNHGVLPPATPMPDNWLEPPVRVKFRQEVEAELERQREQGKDNGSGPITH